MNPRLVAVLAVLWALVAVAATSMGDRNGDRAVAVQDPAAQETKPFKHSEHVSKSWQSLAIPEVFRDCRGCHRFAADNAFSTPQAECDGCHQGAGKLQSQFANGWNKDLSALATRTSPAFRHHTHGMLECRQCHHDEVGLLAHFPIQTGPALCAQCHEKSVTAADVQQFRWLAGTEDAEFAKAVGLAEAFVPPQAADAAAYALKLDQVFAGPTGGINTTALPSGGDFDHADHIQVTSRGDRGLACAVCHSDIQTAAATQVGTATIPTDGCKQCHIRNAAGAAADAVQSAKQTEPRPLWSLGTFAHADHFGFLRPGAVRKQATSSAEAYQEIESKQCAACHTYAPEVAGLSERDFPFDGKSSKHTYAACVQCHADAGWQTGEQVGSQDNPPLHSSNGGTGFSECAACHELGKPDMAGLRPQEPVQRWSERTFVFEGQTHPHITSQGIARATASGNANLQQDCAVCHRAVVPSLPTRLIEKAFTHKTHLPAEPTQKDCAGCHETAQAAANSLALAGVDFRTYTLKSCSSCHWGGEVTERVEPKEQPAQRSVVAFPHGPHVQAGQSCLECHEPGSDGRDVVTKAAALSCKQCHKHEAVAGARPPERLIASEVASCVRCHHEDQAGTQVVSVPPAQGSDSALVDRRYRATQTVFAGFQQSQFHPAGGTCTDCHIRQNSRGKFAPIVVPTGKSHIEAARGPGVHADVARGGFGKNAPADCLRCHWKSVGKWQDTVRLAADEPAGSREFRQAPDSPKTRARFGNLFRGYPGSKDADG